MSNKNKTKDKFKRVMILGATSGIGRELALTYLRENDKNIVGVAGRRTEKLQALQAMFPDRVRYRTMDVTQPDSTRSFDELAAEMGGIDIMIYSAGVGTQNRDPMLDPHSELPTVMTNVTGFTRMVMHTYNYLKASGGGQIVAIASLAGIRPLRQSPAYSSTKRYQIHYMSCLAQRANKAKYPIRFTTIIPGFIRTSMLKYDYPFTTSLEKGTHIIYKAISKKKRCKTVPGYWNAIKAIWRLIPAWERVW